MHDGGGRRGGVMVNHIAAGPGRRDTARKKDGFSPHTVGGPGLKQSLADGPGQRSVWSLEPGG